jgi:Co/Zn/Cd efflux system component
LLADAGHNLSDVAGPGTGLGGGPGRRSPCRTHRHTYGWQRASILAAFANAVLLLVAMGSLLWEAGHRLQAPRADRRRHRDGSRRHRHVGERRHGGAVHLGDASRT